MKTAICPGSFDPVTLGHIDIIDKQGNIYSLTISNISSFYVNLASYLPMNMDERMFFATK